jgi:hypothetical protein
VTAAAARPPALLVVREVSMRFGGIVTLGGLSSGRPGS